VVSRRQVSQARDGAVVLAHTIRRQYDLHEQPAFLFVKELMNFLDRDGWFFTLEQVETEVVLVTIGPEHLDGDALARGEGEIAPPDLQGDLADQSVVDLT